MAVAGLGGLVRALQANLAALANARIIYMPGDVVLLVQAALPHRTVLTDETLRGCMGKGSIKKIIG
jgi:hypothetical protein